MSSTLPIDSNTPVFLNPDYSSKLDSWNGRKVVHLPVTEENRSQWESYGINWIEPAFGNQALANAVLPEGWKLRCNFDHQSFTVLDSNLFPKATIDFSIDRSNHLDTQITFLSQEASKRQFEIKEINMEAKKRNIAKGRSDTWSESHPFWVCHPSSERTAEHQLGLHPVDPITNFADELRCYGFFKTKDLADLAKDFLETHTEFPINALEMDKRGFEALTRDGYTLINPFI